jgi:hypothetical protein
MTGFPEPGNLVNDALYGLRIEPTPTGSKAR